MAPGDDSGNIPDPPANPQPDPPADSQVCDLEYEYDHSLGMRDIVQNFGDLSLMDPLFRTGNTSMLESLYIIDPDQFYEVPFELEDDTDDELKNENDNEPPAHYKVSLDDDSDSDSESESEDDDPMETEHNQGFEEGRDTEGQAADAEVENDFQGFEEDQADMEVENNFQGFEEDQADMEVENNFQGFEEDQAGTEVENDFQDQASMEAENDFQFSVEVQAVEVENDFNISVEDQAVEVENDHQGFEEDQADMEIDKQNNTVMICQPCIPYRSIGCDEDECKYFCVHSDSTKCGKHGGYSECMLDDCSGFVCKKAKAVKLCSNHFRCDEDESKYFRVRSDSTKCGNHGGYSECKVDDCSGFVCNKGVGLQLCSNHFRCDEDGCKSGRVRTASTKCGKHGGYGECEIDDCYEFVCHAGRKTQLCSNHFLENAPKCNEEGCETILKYQVFAESTKYQVFAGSTEECIGLCDRHLYDYLFQNH